MKVLLIQDVYKLGKAGEVKKVANGYGRNYLIPQGLAVLATKGSLKQADKIAAAADERRAKLNNELGSVAEKISATVLKFTSKAGETGKLYGSITSQMIAEALQEKLGNEVDKRSIETPPIRNLGEHLVTVQLTVDLTPAFKVIVFREGEAQEVESETEETTEETAAESVESTSEEVAESIEAEVSTEDESSEETEDNDEQETE